MSVLQSKYLLYIVNLFQKAPSKFEIIFTKAMLLLIN